VSYTLMCHRFSSNVVHPLQERDQTACPTQLTEKLPGIRGVRARTVVKRDVHLMAGMKLTVLGCSATRSRGSRSTFQTCLPPQ
jgi:hypothetical protein